MYRLENGFQKNISAAKKNEDVPRVSRGENRKSAELLWRY